MKKLILAVLPLLITTTLSDSLAQRAPTKPVGVYVAPVNEVKFVDQVEALGSLVANENVELASTVTELITAVEFTDGQRVKRGDLLVEMDSSEEQALLAEEQVRVDEAQRRVDRFKPLIERGAAAEATLDESLSSLNVAQARLLAIQARIDQRRILAPFDGVLGLRNVSVGTLVQPGSIISTIDDDSVMKLDFSVPEVFLQQLRPGIEIKATTSAFPGKTYSGTLASVDSRVDVITRSIVVRALLQNPDRTLLPGLLMRVVLQKNPRQTLVIQEESVIVDGEAAFALVAVDKGEGIQAERRTLELGARREGEVEVLSGLAAGEQVIVHGALKVGDGQAIEVLATESKNETLKELLEQQQHESSTTTEPASDSEPE